MDTNNKGHTLYLWEIEDEIMQIDYTGTELPKFNWNGMRRNERVNEWLQHNHENQQTKEVE